MRSTPGAAASERGVTVLELGVAVALLLLVLATSVVSVRAHLADRQLTGWTETLVNDVRAAQQLGISRRAVVTVTFTPRAGAAPAGYTTQIGGTTLRRQPLPVPLDLATTLPGNTLQFNTLGVPLIPAAAEVTVTHPSRGASRVVTIAPLTGAITVGP